MSRSRLTFFATFLIALLTGAGLLWALPALAQEFDFNAFGQAAGFSTDLDIRIMIARLIRTVISFAGIVLVVLIIYGGFVWMTAAGSAERVDKAKKILTNAAIGMVIVVASFAITTFILGALTEAVGGGVTGDDDGGGGYYPGPGGAGTAFVLTGVNTECAAAMKNLQLQMIFSKTVNEDTVMAGGIRIRPSGGGADVPGAFTVSSRKVTFTPDQICPEDPNEYCFDALTDYNITLDPAILTSSSGTDLSCDTVNPCQFDFTTGENLDLSGPAIEVDAPEAGQSLMANNIELLQSVATDDTGVSSVEFTVDGELIFEAGLADSTAGTLSPVNYFHTDDTQWETTGYVTNESYRIRARGYDCSGKSASATVNAVLRAENCFNLIQDADLGETDVDCGGETGNEFYCGACVGDQCVSDEDCASGSCENGFCIGATIIERVSPGDGAPGNLITISGRGFGDEPGSIVFLGADGVEDDFVVSAPYECQGADTWTDSQIIIQLQDGMLSGPIKIQTTELNEDFTNDAAGPYIPDFQINDIVRPGLCNLNPAISTANQEIRFLGNNFGDERNSSTAFFGRYNASSYSPDWTDNEFGAVIPLITAGRYNTQVFVGDNLCSEAATQCNGDADCPEGESCLIGRQGSNKINFQLLAEDSAAVPVITLVDSGWQACVSGDADMINRRCVADDDCGTGGECAEAGNWGPSGQYVSIFGSNFGNSVGTIRFVNNLGDSANNGVEALGSDEFADVCEDVVYWRDSVITVKVPDEYLNDSALEAGDHLLYVKRQEGTVSNQVEFYVVDDEPGPAICAIVPSAGPTGSDVDILGENFGDADASVWFTPTEEATGVQSNQTYATQVPAGAQTGNVFLANSAGYGSNQMPFTVGDCREEDICAPGESCCADGTCQLECPITDVASNYAYRFSTGPVPVAPEVVQLCDGQDLGIISPTPWGGHTRTQDICINARISASFRVGSDMFPEMDPTSLNNSANILVEKCLDQDCADRESVDREAISFLGPGSPAAPSGFVWSPSGGSFEPNTRYLVTLNGYLPEEDGDAIQLLDGEYLQDDFVWDFTTANSDVPCSVGALMVSPGEYTAELENELVKYSAQPVAAGSGGECILLECRDYSDQYAWNSDDPVAAPLIPESQSACGINAEAREETRPGDFITISSSIADPPAAGDGQLAIHFVDPEIVSYWPNCETACVNAEIGAGFNIDMDILYFSLDKCDTEACQNPTLIWQYAQWLDHDTYTHHVWPDDPLEPNTFYRITYYPNTQSASGRLLSAVYGSSGFSWQFRTKDDPTFCAVDRVEVTPEQAKMTRIGDKQIFRATPYGAPDDCSANGQMLNASEYDWDPWQAEDAPNRVPDPAVEPDPVVVATLRDSGSLALSSDLEPGCSSDCRHTGSAIQAGIAVCGDGFVDPNAEDCDDGNLLPDDGCSPTCLFEGAFTCQNNSRCATDADCAGLGLDDETCFDRNDSCGNGVLDTGEECDDGRQCANGVSCTDDQDCVDVGDGRCLVRAGDGCNARCLHEPGSALGYTCGNGDQASVNVAGGYIGEECDDNNSTNGDGCSSQCLHEGSIPETSVYAICGNGAVEDGEDCDDGNTADDDGCSAWCLSEGTNACVYVCTNIPGQNCQSDADCNDEVDACQPALTPCCGDGDDSSVWETCDDGNSANGDGCSSQCLLAGSSINYGSICGNGLPLETGEACEAAGPLVSGPFAVAEADEGAVEELLAGDEDADIVTSEITGTVVNPNADTVSGTAEFSLACVCETDAQCGDTANYGCGTRGCCFERPEITAMYPGAGQANVCRNTAIWFEFDQVMDKASISTSDVNANFYIKLVNGDGTDVDQANCPEDYLFVADTENLPWYVRAWNWVRDFVLNFFGRSATAAAYQGCIVPNVGYGSEIVGDGSRLRINLSALLNENSYYQVVALDDPNKDDGLAEGLLSKYAVGLKSGSVATFRVGDEICTLDKVIIEDLGKQPFDELDPSYQLFTKSEEVHRLQGAGYSFRNGLNQEIQPIADVYDWEWSWETGYVDDPGDCPADDPETTNINENDNCLANADKNAVQIIEQTTPEISPTAPDTNPTQALVSAANQDGQESAYAIANIITDKKCVGGANAGQACSDDAACPDSTCVAKKKDGSLPLTVLLCENPWPDADFPFVQDSTNERDPADPDDDRGPTNFGFYYCRDAGEMDNTEDDLPALTIQEVTTPAVGDIFREFLFIMEGAGEALGVRVMNNSGYLPPDMWYRKMGFSGSPSPDELDGYQAVRDGNTIYAMAANQTGDIYPNIYVLSTTDDPSPEAEAIFEQIQENWTFNANTDVVSDHRLCVDDNYEFVTNANGGFVPCNWDGDCQSGSCSANKTKLQRDLVRLTDLVRVKSSIKGTCENSQTSCSGNEDCPGGEACINLAVPKLAEGSFIRAMSTSKWPSWQAVLGNALGQALPEDPLNVFASCPGEPFDPETCFNAVEGVFECAQGSHIYGFSSSVEGGYTLISQLEYDKAPWKPDIDPVIGDNAEIIAEYDNYRGPFVVTENPDYLDNFLGYEYYFDSLHNLANNLSFVVADPDELVASAGRAYAAHQEIENEIANDFPVDSDLINGRLEVVRTESGFWRQQFEATIYWDIFALNSWFTGFEGAINELQQTPVSSTGYSRASPNLSSGFRSQANFCDGTAFGDSPQCDSIKSPSEICAIGEVTTESCPGGLINLECLEDILPGETEGVCRFETVAEALGRGEPCRTFQCGNGTVEGDEECDDGALNGSYGYCGPDCTSTPAFYCGDGYLAGGEECDCGTVQNRNSLPGSSWAKSGNNCAAANGQYVTDINQACAFDCTKPGPSCGDGLLNGNEVCDTGNPDLNYQEESCGLDPATGREEFKHRTCNNTCTGWTSYSACAPKGSCGDGEIQGTEECDDGNDNNNDACLKIDPDEDGIFECKTNICGDGFINAGVESCDEGKRNGVECEAAYDSVCYYCTETCQYKSKSGPFCGDSIINGTETCDSTTFNKRCYQYDGYSGEYTVGGVCQSSADCTGPGSWQCTVIGYCNGGTRNGEPCRASSSYQCPGSSLSNYYECMIPRCSSNCTGSCPKDWQTVSLLAQTETAGASAQPRLELYGYQNPEGNSPDRGALLLPACRLATEITANIEAEDVYIPDSVDIVFVTDVSGSMGTIAGGGKSRMQVTKEATVAAIERFLDSYARAGKTMRIALVSFSPSGYSERARLDQEFTNDRQTLVSKVNSYTAGGSTYTAEALQLGLETIGESNADSRILILLSDGNPSNPDGDVVDQVYQTNGEPTPAAEDIEIYTAVINDSDNLIGLMRHISKDTCPVADYQNRDYDDATVCQPNYQNNIQYAYQGLTTEEIEGMYDDITNTILGLIFAFTTEGPHVTSGGVGEGFNTPLPFPDNFRCTDQPTALPISISFDQPDTTVTIENFQFEYCPAD